jgi:predicted ATPase/class 3 adenylate cyclase
VDAERRQVTVLFTDMVGFTTYSEKSGEEAAYTLMRSLSKLTDEAVREQGGVVQSFTGDGVMAVFGAPVAFEDAPLRACRAALHIVQRLKEAGSDLEAKHRVRPQLRIGLNTGAAVVGKVQEGAEAQITVLGDTVNFASRLQALAEPDSIFLSEATHRLVQGMVEATFVGEHTIKGKTGSQKVYRLDGIRQGATRFEAAVTRGLGAFVGREHELEVLERELDEARSRLRVIDIAAEPGMGKSRLLHEFRQRIGKDRAFILTGSCSPDGQQTPFLPFIEVIRGSFRVRAGEAEKDITQKLETGLTALGLHSLRNLGLLLHLLGLKAPDDALAGLDGVLIGLRARDLLQQLLEARCGMSPVIMLIEDLHWIEGVSEELLNKITDSEAKLRLLVLTTRRPEYSPLWLDRAVVTKLRLEALPSGDIRRLVQHRLGVEVLPDTLARQVTEKAEGNPLFAEEIVSYLTDRGLLRSTVEFDASTLAEALPQSVQSLLTARVDRLAPNDRALLQAASVIGRQFNPQLLAAAIRASDVDARLAAMRALDLVRLEDKSGDYAFKHALVRDALYQSLLSDVRRAVHLKIADEIERRSGNRLTEVAEILAHHYSRTDSAEKAFTYLSMSGSKSLNVYSLDESLVHFTAALAFLDNHSSCATDGQVTDFLISYSRLLLLRLEVTAAVDVLQRYFSRVESLGDHVNGVVARSTYVLLLANNARYQEAAAIQRQALGIAERLGDSTSKAYAFYGEIALSTIIAPKQLKEFHELKEKAVKCAREINDGFLLKWLWWVIGFDELFRGRTSQARDAALEVMRVGQSLKDPESTGIGLWMLTYVALGSDSYAEALEYGEESLSMAVTPLDRAVALGGKACSLVMLRRIVEAVPLLEAQRHSMSAGGHFYNLAGTEPFLGLCRILEGKISEGIRYIDNAILSREKEGFRGLAAWCRLFLAEVYLEIRMGNQMLPFPLLLKNSPILLNVYFTASKRILALIDNVLRNTQLDPNGHHVGRAHMILGLLYKGQKKRILSVRHLTEAQRIFSQFGQTPILARVETALAELKQ